MFKFVFTVALIAAHFCAKAQIAYVGKTSIENLKVINYKRYPQAERIIENDTTYFIDWATHEMVIDGDALPIRAVLKSGNSVSIKYGNYWTVTLILSYNKEGNCIGYKFEL